jgi:tetratricopeptide (TPR) repeat protein
VSWDRGTGRDSRVRIAPALTQVADDTQIWADQYDRVATDIFAIQSEVAESAVRAMGVKLVPRERAALRAVSTNDTEAYGFYLRGLEFADHSQSKEDQEGALRMFQAAVDRDTRFTQALARLARTHASMYFYYFDRSQERVDKAKDALDRLAALGPDLPETHIARGYYYYWALGDYPRALEEFKAALSLQPSNAEVLEGVSYVLRRQGRWQESAEQSAKWLEIDPRSPIALTQHGLTCVLLRRYAEADRVFALSLSLNPQSGFYWAWRALISLLWRGDVEKARSFLSQAHQVPLLNDAQHRLAHSAFRIALIRRDQGALRLLDGEKREAFSNQWSYLPIENLRGEAHRLSGENDRARISFEASRRRLQG